MSTILKSYHPDLGIIIAKNYDIPRLTQLIAIANQREEVKKAYIKLPQNPVSWRVIHGSVGITHIAKDIPIGGMNERGLVVEQTGLWSTVYPLMDERPAINEHQWIQFMLDNCSTVREVIEYEKKIRISQNHSNQHYLIADVTGDVVIIEYLLGETVIHESKEIPVQILTNDAYSTCIDYLKIHKGFGGSREIPKKSPLSLDRFIHAVIHSIAIHKSENLKLEDIFESLDNLKSDDTAFSLIYIPEKLEMYVLLSGYEEFVLVDMKALDFSPSYRLSGIDFFKASNGEKRRAITRINESVNRRLLETFFFYDNPYKLIRNSSLEKDVESLIEHCSAFDHN